MQTEVLKTIEIASLVCTQRSYTDFIYNCKDILPEYFGFEGVGILFRDMKTDNLFTIDDKLDEADKEIMETKRTKELKGERLTEEEKIADMTRQYKQRSKHIFPNYLGVTGEAFRTGKIVYHNEIAGVSNYLPSIDNLSHSVKDVQNIMVVPIFGHKHDENSRKIRQNAHMPIGILQFINKKDLKMIDDFDIEKVREMNGLLGKSLENCSEHNTVINVRVGMIDHLSTLDNCLDQSYQTTKEISNNLLEAQEQPMSKLRSNINTMTETQVQRKTELEKVVISMNKYC